jgi:hypothetical protein
VFACDEGVRWHIFTNHFQQYFNTELDLITLRALAAAAK